MIIWGFQKNGTTVAKQMVPGRTMRLLLWLLNSVGAGFDWWHVVFQSVVIEAGSQTHCRSSQMPVPPQDPLAVKSRSVGPIGLGCSTCWFT